MTPVPIQSLIGLLLRRASVAGSVASRARVQSEPPEPLRWPQAPAPPTPPEQERERKDGREKTKSWQMNTNEMSRGLKTEGNDEATNAKWKQVVAEYCKESAGETRIWDWMGLVWIRCETCNVKMASWQHPLKERDERLRRVAEAVCRNQSEEKSHAIQVISGLLRRLFCVALTHQKFINLIVPQTYSFS